MNLLEAFNKNIKFKIYEINGNTVEDFTKEWLDVVDDIKRGKRVVWCFYANLYGSICEPLNWRKNQKNCMRCKEIKTYYDEAPLYYPDDHYEISSVEEYFDLIQDAVDDGYLKIEFIKESK